MNLYHTQSTKQFVEGTTPTAPPSGVVTLFASASALNVIDSGGNVTEIGGGGGGGVTVSDTAPSSPANGDLWFNSDTGSLYVWYVDADGGQWVLPDLNISTGIISLSSQVAHILPVENGGTGASSLSSVSLSSFSSESATDGYVATADGAGSIVWEAASGGGGNWTDISTNAVELRDETNGTEMYLYNTYTDASNYERGFMRWDTNEFIFGYEQAGTGSPWRYSKWMLPRGFGVQLDGDLNRPRLSGVGSFLQIENVGFSSIGPICFANVMPGTTSSTPSQFLGYLPWGYGWHGLIFREIDADPADPGEGLSVMWQSNGTASGDDGDIMMKITAGGVTKTVTLVDFSAI